MSIKDKYRVQSIKKEETKECLLYKHYAKRIPPISYAFGLYSKDLILKGVCTFGTPPIQMNNGHCIFNEGDIRQESESGFKVKTVELNRLCVEDNLEKNTLSFFVSSCLSMLPKPMCVVSFSDQNQNHHGYIYQATNWIYTGMGERGGKMVNFVMNGREYHGRGISEEQMKNTGYNYDSTKTLQENWILNGGEIIDLSEGKHRYLMFLGDKRTRKEMKNKLKYEIKSYPKGENDRYDSSYKPSVQATLF